MLGLPISTRYVGLVRIELNRLGLVGKGMERNRRPTDGKDDTLIALFEPSGRQIVPIGRIVKFAIATAMRLDEICGFDCAYVNERKTKLHIRTTSSATTSGAPCLVPAIKMAGASWPNWHSNRAQRNSIQRQIAANSVVVAQAHGGEPRICDLQGQNSRTSFG